MCILRTTVVGFCDVCTTGHTLTILLHREVCGSSGGAFVCGINCVYYYVCLCGTQGHNKNTKCTHRQADSFTYNLNVAASTNNM